MSRGGNRHESLTCPWISEVVTLSDRARIRLGAGQGKVLAPREPG
jgi:hypothetical protein